MYYQISNGIIQIDEDDLDMVSKVRWRVHKNGYVTSLYRTGNKARMVRLHRLIMELPEGMQVDHINHDKLDNRKYNLRVCTQQQNSANARKTTRKTTSKYKGIHYYKKCNLWRASISKTHLGYFKTELEAKEAYDKAASKLFGEFFYQTPLP